MCLADQLRQLYQLRSRVSTQQDQLQTYYAVTPCKEAALRVTAVRLSTCLSVSMHRQLENEQELSYRKQIAHQLFTQYVEVSIGLNITLKCLKSRLSITQGH